MLKKEIFIKKAIEKYGNKFDYSKVEYVNCNTKVCIICPEHGEFWQTPTAHLNGNGCLKCSYVERSKNKRKKIEKFIEDARKIHGNKYDYSKVEYKNNRTKVCIICHEHGEFWQTPAKHLFGQGCPSCSGNKKGTTVLFLERARKIHGDKYDYSKVEYINNSTKVCIICQEHGEFWQIPKDHLKGQGCPKCKMKRHWETRGKITKEDFIKRAKEIHGDKYDYSKVNYINTKTKVCIICHEKDGLGKEHGEYWQTPESHLSGQRCPKCSKVYKPTTEEWMERAKNIHRNKYDYSKVEYKNSRTKVCIICPEHGEFWQTPAAHLNGQGCPLCDMSHIENEMNDALKIEKIEFINETNLNGLLGRMRVDFFIPELNTVIECQGGQHFYGGFDRKNKTHALAIHKKVLERDVKKYNILKENNIKVLYFCHKEDYEKRIKEENEFKKIYNKENTFFTTDDLIKFLFYK